VKIPCMDHETRLLLLLLLSRQCVPGRRRGHWKCSVVQCDSTHAKIKSYVNCGRKAKATRSAAEKCIGRMTLLYAAAIRIATWSTVNNRMTTAGGDITRASLDSVAGAFRGRLRAICLALGNRGRCARHTPTTRATSVYYR